MLAFSSFGNPAPRKTPAGLLALRPLITQGLPFREVKPRFCICLSPDRLNKIRPKGSDVPTLSELCWVTPQKRSRNCGIKFAFFCARLLGTAFTVMQILGLKPFLKKNAFICLPKNSIYIRTNKAKGSFLRKRFPEDITYGVKRS